MLQTYGGDVLAACPLQALLLVCPIFLNDEWIISAFFRLLLHLHQLVLGNFEIYQQVSHKTPTRRAHNAVDDVEPKLLEDIDHLT